MRAKTDAAGNPLFPVCGWHVRVVDGAVLFTLRFLFHPEQVPGGSGATPTYKLSAQQAAQLAGALQAQVMELTRAFKALDS